MRSSANGAWAVMVMCLACRPTPQLESPQSTAEFVQSAQALTLTTRELSTLRWIEGIWKGTGGGEADFYERYTFVDDSTLRVDGFVDSTLTTVSDSTFFGLRAGRFSNMSVKARWTAVRLKDGAITFIPVRAARNVFVWRPGSRDLWFADTAYLPPLDATRVPCQPSTYRMSRIVRQVR